MSDHRFSWKKMSTKFLVSFFVFIQIFSFAFAPFANAQAGVPQYVVDPQLAGTNTWLGGLYSQAWEIHGLNQSENQVDQGLLSTGIASLIHGFSFFMDKIAYDTANYIAHGGKGQSGLVFKQGFKDYIQTTALDAVGDFIANFSTDALGVNFCQIPDPNVAIFLTIGFKSLYGMGPPKSDCSWQTLSNNWTREAFEERYGPGGSRFLAETFSASLKVSDTDFGIALNTISKLDQISAQTKGGANSERLEGAGFKPLTDAITGNIRTPSQLVKDETSLASNSYRVKASNEALWGIAASGAKQSFLFAGSVFLNTLTSQLLNQILTKGFLGDDTGSDDEGTAGVAGFFSSPLRNTASSPYAQLLTARPTPQVTNFDLISEFASCPDSPGINNCVIDTSFQKILAIANTGKPLTIREALDQGLLHGDWPLISPRREEDNTASNCYLNKYCYSNIQKLRKVDILPLGFEIAALRSDNEIPWTLNTVVANFEKCLRVNERGEVDPNGKIVKESSAFPFCHLINPNWVLRASAMYCDAKVITNSLVSKDSSQRREECVDVKTCINPGPNGSCAGEYAYCTQEKNVWVMPGQSCPSEYNTCTTYTNTKGGKSGSYLARTVDYGECSIDNVGCRAYSTEKDANGAWIATSEILARGVNQLVKEKDAAGRNSQVFFDDSMKSESSVCRPGSNGCTAFYPALQQENGQYVKTDAGKYVENKNIQALVHLKKAPDYLGCYDANPALVNGVQEVEWPTTLAEVSSRVSQNPACNAFASACVASEVGCEAYNPTAGGPMIPGVIGAQNVCASECVGYATFKQEAGEFAKFDHEKFPVFFIPSTGKSCDARFSGCEEFTNIDTGANGGEKQEYYTDLAYCEKPAADGSNQKTFYTWEGSITEGLALRTHKILPVSADEASYITAIDFGPDDALITGSFPVGSPAYGDDSYESLRKANTLCNESNYNERLNNRFSATAASADCKAFYDDSGAVFYRLLGEDKSSPTKVVTISAACHPLRKTTPVFYSDESLRGKAALCAQKGGSYDNQNGDCRRCMNGGRFENNFCVYQTISRPGESTSCPATANGCRAYTGSTNNNVREIISNEDFEIAADATAEQAQALLADWAPSRNLRISPESTHPGGHSLEAVNDISRTVASGTFSNAGWYELSFWAKGSNQVMEVNLSEVVGGNETRISNFTVDPSTGLPSQLSIGGEWQSYRLGPVYFDSLGANGDMRINFERMGANNNPIYIDHIRFTQVRDSIYLLKDSWKTPDSCDSNPSDGLPGEALGCAAYKDSKNQTRYATGFEKLCREKAVSCQPFWDTHNTVNGEDAAQKQVFNLLCNTTTGRIDGTKCSLVSSGANNRLLGECSLKPGATSCFVVKVSIGADENITELLNAASVVPSTLVVPGDTPEAAPIFLANRKEFQCSQNERGCMAVGLEQQIISNDTVSSSYKHTDILVKNDPEKYNETLCRSDLVGCSEYKSAGNLTYFKDPQIIGSRFCTFQPQEAGDDTWGWFQDGVGKCSNNNARLCRGDSDCSAGGTCDINQKVECYPDYQRQGGMFDLWSNSSTSTYKGFVGVCPSTYNQCTELIDPADTSLANPKGQPYYVIYNKNLTAQSSECKGKVSLSEGCVLFDKTDDPNKLYNSAATYADSEKADPRYAPVTPNKTGTFNSNIILKVDRNRMCSRWLACKTRIRQVDDSGKQTTLCYAFSECEKEEGGTCVKWVDDFENNSNISDAQNRLTYDRYISRGTSWYDREFSGYSLYNKFRIDNFTYVSINLESLIQANYLGSNEALEFRDRQFVAYQMDDQFFAPNTPYAAKGCSLPGVKEWQSCGYDNGGRCYNSKCIYPITGPLPATAQVGNGGIANYPGMVQILRAFVESGGNYCKGFPEKDSPFPQEVAKVNKNKDVKTLSEGISRIDYKEFKDGFNKVNVCQDGNCSCGYNKILYKNGTADYWSFGGNTSQDGICLGGPKEGIPCNDSEACGEGGQCQFQQKKETHYGFKGYCLEFDRSRPTGLGEQPYECLTWLPIQVSASGIDNYNSNAEAGYLPSEDAPHAGEVFCSASTDANRGPYDSNLIGVIANNFPLQQKYSEKFNEDGTPDLGAVRVGQGVRRRGDVVNDCAHVEDESYYESYMCSANLSTVYKGVQTWLWKQQTEGLKNTVLLRVESRKEDEEGDRDWGLIEDKQKGYITPYSFAPVPGDNTNSETGFIMHPPRLWPGSMYGDDPHIGEGRGPSYRWGKVVKPMTNLRAVDRDLRIFTHAASPQQNAYTISDGFLYRSPLEEQIKESYLSKVFFLPLSYPDKLHSNAPPLFSKDFGINFDALRSPSGRQAYAHAVRQSSPQDREFTEPGDEEELLTWEYVLQGEELAKEGRNADYKIFSDDVTEDDALRNQHNTFVTVGNEERNKIAKRYVVVYSDYPDAVPSFISANVPANLAQPASPPSVDNDPFNFESVSCTRANGGADTNWLAIGMDFNSDGEFLGYVSRWCNTEIYDLSADHPTDDDVGIQFAVAAQVHDMCSEFVQVYDSDPASGPLGETNKAWTQLVWKGAVQKQGNEFIPQSHPNPDYAPEVRRTTALDPYGSLNLLGEVLKKAEEVNGSDRAKLQNYIFGPQWATPNRLQSGIPYSCTKNWFGLPNLLDDADCSGLDLSLSADVPGNDLQSLRNKIGNIPTNEDGVKGIQDLFVKFYATASRNANQNIFENNIGVNTHPRNNDVAGDTRSYKVGNTDINLLPPQIYSLNTFRCRNSTTHKPSCVAGESNNLTVNFRNGVSTDYDADGLIDEDANGDRVADAIIQDQSLTATLDFFAFADDNRMPIRRVMIKWNDGSDIVNDGRVGFYKNRKPYCEQEEGVQKFCGANGNVTDAVKRQLTCKEESDCSTGDKCVSVRNSFGDRFGSSDRACTAGYFEFIHDYTCSRSDIPVNGGEVDAAKAGYVKKVSDPIFDEPTRQRLLAKGLQQDSFVCVFQPQVQVLDNWGWCNGSCNGAGNTGCYNEQVIGPGRIKHFCDNVNSSDPWTTYKGQIIVIPLPPLLQSK